MLFAADFHIANGYGEMSRQLLRSLDKICNLSIATDPMFYDQLKSSGYGSKLVGHYINPDLMPMSYLSIQPIDHQMRRPVGKRNALLTMWESSKVPEQVRRVMSLYDLILTPNSFNACNFAEQTGKPCVAVSHGCDPNIYRHDFGAYWNRINEGQLFTFGAAAHLGHSRIRKGFERIVNWFTEAFPKEKKVRLLLKANNWEGNNFSSPDPRIELIEKDLTDQECAEWLRSIDCYIDGSTFEGWGMWTHSAMATGRPVIATNYSARADYFAFGNHIPIGYTLQPSQEMYEGLGHWAMPKDKDAIEAMRWAFNNREECFSIGVRAHQSTKHLTWDEIARRVLAALRKYDIIGNRVLL